MVDGESAARGEDVSVLARNRLDPKRGPTPGARYRDRERPRSRRSAGARPSCICRRFGRESRCVQEQAKLSGPGDRLPLAPCLMAPGGSGPLLDRPTKEGEGDEACEEERLRHAAALTVGLTLACLVVSGPALAE